MVHLDRLRAVFDDLLKYELFRLRFTTAGKDKH
jgi:hypothetical protein